MDHATVDTEISHRIIEKIKRTNQSLGTCLERASLWELKNNHLSISFPSGFDADMVKKDERILCQAGVDLGLPVFTLETSSAPPEEEPSSGESRATVVKRVFRGEIIGEHDDGSE